MGKAHRERIMAILAGKETAISKQIKNVVVKKIQSGSTDSQVGILQESLASGSLSNSRLRTVLETNARKEMVKGIMRFTNKGVTPTVDLLLEEYRKEKAFQKLANSVGLNEQWFVTLAKSECERLVK